MPGILDAFNDPSTQGLLNLSSAFLQAGGPSATPNPTGAAFGNAFQGYQGAQQRQALLNLEQQKGNLTSMQVQAALRQQAMQEWALTGQMPPQGIPGMPGMQQGQGMPQGLPQGAPGGMQLGQPPSPMPVGGGAPMAPQASPQGVPPGSPLAGLPPDAQQAIRLNMAFPGSGTIAMQSTQPVIGREGGIYKKNPDGSMSLDPGWVAGEKQRLELQKGIENQNTVVDVPLANGQVQKMTKTQQLSLVGATNQVKAAIPGLSDTALSDIQRQMAADPDKPIDLNIMLGGREAKLTLQPLNKMPGVVTGQSTEARSAAEKSGTNAGDVQNQIDNEATNALQSRKILGEMRVLAQDFTPGKFAPMQRSLGEWAQAMGLKGFEEKIKSADSQQALQKLTAQMATAAMKQFTNRGTQMEFGTFLKNNPNAELTPGGFQKVLEFMDKSSASVLEKQQAYVEWRKENPLEKSQDFLAEWNKKQNAELAQPAGPKAPPQKGAVVDGWEYIGGDPGQRMNWRKK